MAVFADRVRETTTTTGTGTVNLDGSPSGFQSFADAIGDANECYYAIVNESEGEWEVGLGTVTDASVDTLSRDSVLDSSNSGALVDFSAGTKQVFVTNPAYRINNTPYDTFSQEARDIMRIIENLAINPGFETVIPGTHGTAILNLESSGEIMNIKTPGWQVVACSGSPIIVASDDTSVIAASGSSRALQVAITTSGVGVTKVRQILGSTIGGVNQFTLNEVYKMRGRYLNMAGDSKMQSGIATGQRLYIYTDGTGGTTTYGDYHGNNTDWERLTIAVQVPVDATKIHYGWEIGVNANIHWFDNVVVFAAGTSLNPSALDYQPRMPVTFASPFLDVASNHFTYLSAADTNYRQSGIGATGVTADYDFNANRPAWATGFKALVYGQGGAAASYGTLRPNGFTNSLTFLGCVTYNSLDVALALGVDGQIEVSVSNTNNDLLLKIIRWSGDEL